MPISMAEQAFQRAQNNAIDHDERWAAALRNLRELRELRELRGPAGAIELGSQEHRDRPDAGIRAVLNSAGPFSMSMPAGFIPLGQEKIKDLQKQYGDGVTITSAGWVPIPSRIHTEDVAVPMEHSGIFPHECPACAAYAASRKVRFEVSPVARALMADGPTTSEGLAGKADEVIKGIIDGQLSRQKVKEIGRAVNDRQDSDGKSDALGRAIRFTQATGLLPR